MKYEKIRYWGLWFILIPMLTSCVAEDDDERDTPYFKTVECRQTIYNQADRCGVLVVPEDRRDPQKGRINVYVTIYAPPGERNPDALPTIFLNGGPGAGNGSFYEIFGNPDNSAFFLRTHMAAESDLILLDQRGTNYSTPSLYCQGLAAFQEQAYGWTWQREGEDRVPLMEACRIDYEQQGVDLSGFDTVENAADIRDLVKVLGLQQVNLYAASYGTRLAMITMKLYPEILNSVVLDSILPPETNAYVESAPGTMEGLNALFAAAKTDYPDLEEIFYAISADLERVPLTVKTSDGLEVTITAPMFVNFVTSKLRSTPYDTNLPFSIYDIFFNKNYTAIADSWIDRVNNDYTGGGPGSDSTVAGFFSSVFAANDAHYTSPEQIEAEILSVTDDPGIQEWLRHEFIYKRPEIVSDWMVQPLSPSIRDPLVSDIPTLMMVGELDVATPSIFSANSVQYLSNANYFRIPAGHGVGFLECSMDMVANFYADPLADPVNSCPTTYEWTPWP